MNRYKIIFILIPIITGLIFAQDKKTNSSKQESVKATKQIQRPVITREQKLTRRFFEVEREVEQIRSELEQLKEELKIYKLKMSLPRIREEIRKLVEIPELTHEITLTNGTVVRGSIIFENIDELFLQTQIGQLRISKNQIKEIQPIEQPHAKLDFLGPIEELNYPDKKVFRGKIKNTGLHSANFIRVLFTLHKEDTSPINTDSSFVNGSMKILRTNVISRSSLRPGEEAEFICTVPTLGMAVSYYTKTIHWDEFE
jgi:hypothetical protein